MDILNIMAQTYFYILLNKNGNMIHTDEKLPIYWNKQVAIKQQKLFNAYEIRKLSITELLKLIEKYKPINNFNYNVYIHAC